MTKRDLITSQCKLLNYAHEHNLAVNNFIAAINAAITGLSNMCPETAISLIEDAQTKIPDIKALKVQKDKADKDFIDSSILLLPPMIHFEEELDTDNMEVN